MPHRICWADLETYSDTPIRQGTYKYAENSEILLWAYAFDDQKEEVWDAINDPTMPKDLHEAINDPDTVFVFHNSMFDRTVLRYNGIEIPVDRVEDTMVQALTHSLPGGLAKLCEVMGVDAEDLKDPRGKELVRMFCVPRPKNQKIRRFTSVTHPKEWEEFKEYAKSDIRAMRSIRNKMPRWNYRDRELELWRLDQRINDRGFAVDRVLAEEAVKAVAAEKKRLADEVGDATFGLVGRATQRDKLLKFILEAYGVDLPDLTKSTLERRINDPDLPIEVRDLLGLRQDTAKASTSKYKSLINGVNDDGRLRGTLQFCGAMRTGRWSGRTFQPQNLYRPTLPQYQIDVAVETLRTGSIDLFTHNVMEMAANAIRGCIIAGKNKKLVVSDLSNIEGRFAAWVSNEDWKVQAFLDFDNGIGEDLYKVAYGRAFNEDPAKVGKGPKRQIGKVMELMLQYEGGVGAFLTGAATYKIDLDELASIARASIPDDVWAEAERFWDWSLQTHRTTYGLEEDTFKVLDSLKRMWRRAHPEITSIWRELKDAVIEAIDSPGVTFQVRRLKVRRDGAWLKIFLPSGRALCYPAPKVEVKVKKKKVKDKNGKETEIEETETFISYAGINPYTRQWGRVKTYGGKLFENICQAGSRDVMAHNMPDMEEAGYLPVLTVHDEVIAEAPDQEAWHIDEFSEILATVPPWAEGLPLAAGGYEDYRYRKD